MLLLALASIFVAVLIVSYGAAAWRDVKNIFTPDVKLQISVSGEGKVSARPDVATIVASIVSQGEYLKDVQSANSQKSNALVAYLKSVGVKEEDIKTVSYVIEPQYRYPQPCPYGSVCPVEQTQTKIIGYLIRNAYGIKVRDLAKAGDVLAGVVGAGANDVSGIQFTIDQPDQLKAEARKKAIDDARAKAEKLAHDLGRGLGPIVNFSESGSQPPIYFERAAPSAQGGGAPAPAVAPGENEIVVDVSITYEFR